LPSGLKAIAVSPPVAGAVALRLRPVRALQNRAVRSCEAVTTTRPSGLNAAALMKPRSASVVRDDAAGRDIDETGAPSRLVTSKQAVDSD
jgi:hypothetical protein